MNDIHDAGPFSAYLIADLILLSKLQNSGVGALVPSSFTRHHPVQSVGLNEAFGI